MKNYNEILAENKAWAEEIFAKIDNKMSAMTIRSRSKVPDGVDADGFHVEKSIDWWTNGFWGGLNWLLYDYTKNEEYMKTAKEQEILMDEALKHYEKLHHDVGFMWHILSGASYRLTGDEASKVRNLFAAASLSSRFVLGGDFIRAWNSKGAYDWTIIDCLMNLPLLYWASDVIGDDRFKRIAMSHADMAICDHLRPDGSVVHIAEHDRETGEVVATYAGQGSAVGSSWSRGQAWAVYGFVISYLHTKEERYLDAAKQVANYFIANCCDDWLPRVDFRAPSQPDYYDCSGAACAACGLIELAKILPENEGGMYMHGAVKILKAITEKFVDFNPAVDNMVNFSTGSYPTEERGYEKSWVHISLIYADYLYTEAVLKLLEAEYFPW